MAGKARTKKRVYFTAERREAYLDCLRVTASHRASAREAGVSERAARRYRARKPGYAALCREAEQEAQRRLAGAEGPFDFAQDRPFDGRLDPAFESIRRGPKGEAKIVRTSGQRWTAKIEELPLTLVHASEGKSARAEPVAVAFENGRARLAGRFPELEDEMAGIAYRGGYEGPGSSPDRADAMVWAMTELVVKPKRAEPRIRTFEERSAFRGFHFKGSWPQFINE